jgi:hypothetical protein
LIAPFKQTIFIIPSHAIGKSHQVSLFQVSFRGD